MSDNNEDFIEVINRIVRVPISSIPPHKPQQPPAPPPENK